MNDQRSDDRRGEASPASGGPAPAPSRTVMQIPSMDCPSEEKLIRERLARVDAVRSLSFDIAARTLTVEHELQDTGPIVAALREIGMTPEVPDSSSTPRASTVSYRIENMDCPSEEKLIRKKLAGMSGIHDLEFDLSARALKVSHTLESTQPIQRALTDVGMHAVETGAECAANTAARQSRPEQAAANACCAGEPLALTRRAAEAAPTRAVFSIDNMDCPTEETLIRDKLSRMEGIRELEFNLMQRTLSVVHTLPSSEPIEQALVEVGLQPKSTAPSAGTQITVLAISKMDCPTEEKLIRDKLATVKGVAAMQFNLVQRTLTLTHTPEALQTALHALESLGFDAQMQSAEKPQALEPPPRTNWWPMIVSGVAASFAEAVYWYMGGNHWLVVVFALLAIFTGGLQTYKKGWIAVKNRNLNMNALMSIAVTGAMLIGQWPEAAMVMFLFALAELIEAKSLDRARDAIRGLMDLAPETTTVKQPDGSWLEVDAKSVVVDAVVRVRPGERIALDGRIVNGRSTVNQAPITGESLPVDKGPGDQVFAATINESGSFEYRVTAPASDSTLARIIHAVEVAQSERAPTQRFVDQFARIYTPAVFVVAFAVALVPPLAFGAAWLEWIYRALVLLVIACPCALVISTPVTIVSGLAAAARRGMLIKGGVYLEGGHALRWLALDKTGTITHGKPVQTDFRALNSSDEKFVRSVAASLATRSDHPVSQAVARAAIDAGVPIAEATDFTAIPGRGVAGVVDGRVYHLGNRRLIKELRLLAPDLDQLLVGYEQKGKTAVVLAEDERALALFAVADTVRETSKHAIADLHSLGVKTMMLSGDNQHTASAIAAQVGIDEARGNLLPSDKLKVIESLHAERGKVGMAGDGINDAPALAKADIGFAMGVAGTDVAIETADVALMDDDLRKIPGFVRLSKKTAAILKQNIFVALAIKAVFIALTFTGDATMWMAVFADMGASLLVVFNGLRLLSPSAV